MDHLEAEVASIAGRLNAAHAELVAATARLIEDELWAGSGIMSPEHWLVLRAGLSPARARDITRIARRSEQLPSTRAALDDGQLSVDQAAVVAKYAPSSHEASITELAVNATVPQLRRTLSRYQFGEVAPATAGPDETPSPEPLLAGTPAWAAAAPELSTSYHEGRFQLSYSAPADIGALVEQALREAKDSLFHAGQEQVSLADGLAEMANRSLSTITATSRASKYRVYIHLSTTGGWVNGRGAIPPSLAAKFACDGVIQPLWETDGRPVSMGRDQRIVPSRTRRLIEDRDRGCRYPGCTATQHVEIHHLDHWAKGGNTDYDRMLSLCPFHHDAHHRAEFTMTGDPTSSHGVDFRNPHGLRIQVARPSAPEPPGYGPARGAASGAAWRAEHVFRQAPGLRPYPGPTGEVLHSKCVDFQPNRPAPLDDAPPDASQSDASPADASQADTSPPDASQADASPPDASQAEASPPDVEPFDTDDPSPASSPAADPPDRRLRLAPEPASS